MEQKMSNETNLVDGVISVAAHLESELEEALAEHRLSLDHPRPLQATEADRDGSGGAAHAGHELALGQCVALGALERVEHQEAGAAQAVLGECLLEL